MKVQVTKTLSVTLILLQNNQIHPLSSSRRLFSYKTLSSFSFSCFLYLGNTFFPFPILKDMTSALSNISKATTEKRCMKRNLSKMLFTLVGGRLTEVRIARLFGESEKIVCRIHCTTLPRNEGKDLVVIHNPKVNHAYAEICYPYFLKPGGPSPCA